MKYRVISTSPIWVKSSPSATGKNIGVLYPDTVVESTNTSGTWIQVQDGWVNTKSLDGEYTYLETTDENTDVSAVNISVGDVVAITSNSATYLDTGETIPNSVKEDTYEVSAISEDGTVALLDFSNARILTSTLNLSLMSTASTETTGVDGSWTDDDSGSDSGSSGSDKTDTGGTSGSDSGSSGSDKTDATKQTNVSADDVKKSGEEAKKEADAAKKESKVDPVKEYEKVQKALLGEYIEDVRSQDTDEQTDSSKLADELKNNYNIVDTRGIFGMPYQYMPIADRRVTNSTSNFSGLGRKYMEKIVARMPLLLITPGVPEFMPGYDSSEKNSVLRVLASIGKSNLEACINNSGKYYSLRYDKQSYFHYVNPLCRMGASYLNIENYELPVIKGEPQKLKSYDWDKYCNTKIHEYMCYKSAIAFYIDSEKQISDSFSNSETGSELLGKLNGVSDMAREINFLMGTASSQIGVELDAFTTDRNLQNNELNNVDFLSRIKSSGNTMTTFLKNLTGQLQTVFAGGKLIFPKIWQDSSFGREYNINIKLLSPDQDVLSWYLNIYVPLMHLICLVAPRQSGPNGYVSPFLVKAYYRGLFNCDLGLITSMSVNRGSEGGWTRNGLPTSVDVSFSIKDLYESFSITSQEKGLLGRDVKPTLLKNIILMDYIANLCGVNINKIDILRTIDFYWTQGFLNNYRDWARLDVYGGLERWATNVAMGMYGKYL